MYITAFASISGTAFEIEALSSVFRPQSIDSERKQKNALRTQIMCRVSVKRGPDTCGCRMRMADANGKMRMEKCEKKNCRQWYNNKILDIYILLTHVFFRLWFCYI